MGFLAMSSYKQEMKQTKGYLKEDKKNQKKVKIQACKKGDESIMEMGEMTTYDNIKARVGEIMVPIVIKIICF